MRDPRETQESADRVVNWLFVIAITAAVLWFFLSSARPALSMQYAGDVHLSNSHRVYTEVVHRYEPPQAVPYLEWDTSKALEPWYDLMLLQLRLGSLIEFNDQLDQQRHAMERIERKQRIEEWRKGNLNYVVLGLFIAVIAFFLWCAYAEGKRLSGR